MVRRSARSFASTNDPSVVEARVVREKPQNHGLLQQQQLELDELERKLEIARRNYQQATQNDVQREALRNLIQCYEDLAYWEEALRAEETYMQDYCSEDNKERSKTLYRIGKLHMRLEHAHVAQQFYQDALALTNPDDSLHGHVLISMAGVSFHRGNLLDALHFLEQASQVNPNDGELQVKCRQHQGLIYRTMEDFEQALMSYELALQVCADDERRFELQMDRADILLVLDQTDQALQVYEQLLQQVDRTSVDASVLFHNIGRVHAQMELYDSAQEHLQRAVQLKTQWTGSDTHPEVGKSLQALGAVYAVRQDKHAALECFQQALLIARMHSTEGDADPVVMLALRNIALVKGETVPKW